MEWHQDNVTLSQPPPLTGDLIINSSVGCSKFSILVLLHFPMRVLQLKIFRIVPRPNLALEIMLLKFYHSKFRIDLMYVCIY